MKGFMIYETPLWGNEENTVYLQEVKDASYTLKLIDSDITCYLEGTATREPITKATCNKDDTYDFETGALIALMKRCGVDKVVRACNEAFSEDTFKTYAIKYERELNELKKEKEKLQHEYDLCKNSENALKCSVDYLNKTIAKLNTAIYGYKEDLNKVTKRCRELEAKEDILNKQEETINKREEKLFVYFGGRQNGKQHTLLVDLFKKINQKKVDAAYKKAYNTTLPLWQKEVLNQMYEIRKIEASKYSLPHVHEWFYRIPTKRDEMWEKIFALHKESDVIIKVKREDVTTFLHEIENRIPEITWYSNVKIFETRYTIGDIYEELKTCDAIYFRLHKRNKLSYTSDSHIYPYRELKPIDYLPPMRWDLFKKGRIIVKVNDNNYEDFYNKCEEEIGRKPFDKYTGTFTVYYKYEKELEQYIFHTRPYKDTIPYAKKIVNWEDVR